MMKTERKAMRFVFRHAAAVLLASAALSSRVEAQWGVEFRGQMGFGGDQLASVSYSDGTESNLTLGKLFTVSLGPSLRLFSAGPSSLELQTMFGWSTWSTGPENTEDRLKISRFPVEGLLFYGHRVPFKNWVLRIGGGGVYQFGGGVSGSGTLEDTDVDIDNTLGGIGEVSIVSGILSFGARYTHVKPAVQGVTMDGSSIGVFFGLTTPR